MAATSSTLQRQDRPGHELLPAFGSMELNVSEIERLASVIAGSALGLYGLTRRSLGGAVVAAVGGCLVYRGLTGHCPVYEALGIDTRDAHQRRAAVRAGHGVRVDTSLTIDRPAEELYRFWRRLENLPRIMRHLKSVRELDDKRSHWVAKGPLGISAEWDAEIITDREPSVIAWRSLPGSEVDTAGSVHFTPAADGRGTQLKVELKYDPAAGKAGALIARLFGEAPEQEIEEDLCRFKKLMEAGKIPTMAADHSLAET
ncbi:MAG TPA: SRPBCC family protein [Gemmataceae bacterium]|jgi:uncharacterized membrane protein|nr:SRPBCC family protein [Gemmataceae bacterium]